VLHAIRSLLCTATNQTPHERLFAYNRKTHGDNLCHFTLWTRVNCKACRVRKCIEAGLSIKALVHPITASTRQPGPTVTTVTPCHDNTAPADILPEENVPMTTLQTYAVPGSNGRRHCIAETWKYFSKAKDESKAACKFCHIEVKISIYVKRCKIFLAK